MGSKRITALLTAIFMAMALLPSFAYAQSMAWDGTVGTAFAGGTGTQEDPYQIADGAQLAYLAQQVNEGDAGVSKKYFKLTDDIDLNNQKWTPIGTSAKPFSGTFDGDMHKISNMLVNGGSASYNGLFGRSGGGEAANAVIKNLIIDHANVTGGSYSAILTGFGFTGTISRVIVVDSNLTGGAYSGGISGQGYATISECAVVGGLITSKSWKVGGIIGQFQEGNVLVEKCYTNTKIKNTGSLSGNYGGIAGMMNYGSTIKNCRSDSYLYDSEKNTSGGIAGETLKINTSPKIEYCLATGFNTYPTGGLVGGKYWRNETDPIVSITSSYWDKDSTTNEYTYTSEGDDTFGVGLTAAQAKTKDSYADWDEAVWNFTQDSYPSLKWWEETAAAYNITYTAPEPVPVTGITTTMEQTQKLVYGDSISLKAQAVPEEALRQTIKWTSSDDTIATVSEAGVVTYQAPGTATITAATAEGDYSLDFSVTCQDYSEIDGVVYGLDQDRYIVKDGMKASGAVELKSEINGLPVTEIGEKAFYQNYTANKNITSVIVPESVTTIGVHAFRGATALSSVTIQGQIGDLTGDVLGIFYNCSGLQEITMHAPVPPKVEKGIFKTCKALQRVYVPGASYGAYAAAWSDVADKIQPMNPEEEVVLVPESEGIPFVPAQSEPGAEPEQAGYFWNVQAPVTASKAKAVFTAGEETREVQLNLSALEGEGTQAFSVLLKNAPEGVKAKIVTE